VCKHSRREGGICQAKLKALTDNETGEITVYKNATEHAGHKSMGLSSSIKNLIDEKAESGQRPARIHHFLLVSFLLYGFLKKVSYRVNMEKKLPN
jgi:hypothetical protein